MIALMGTPPPKCANPNETYRVVTFSAETLLTHFFLHHVANRYSWSSREYNEQWWCASHLARWDGVSWSSIRWQSGKTPAKPNLSSEEDTSDDSSGKHKQNWFTRLGSLNEGFKTACIVLVKQDHVSEPEVTTEIKMETVVSQAQPEENSIKVNEEEPTVYVFDTDKKCWWSCGEWYWDSRGKSSNCDWFATW